MSDSVPSNEEPLPTILDPPVAAKPVEETQRPLDSLDDNPIPPPPTRLDGLPLPQVEGFEIIEELGRGGMGVVYKARQIGLARTVALKMIRDSALAGREEISRFRLEAEAVAQLQHPHIVQIHHIGSCGGLPFFALEYVAGGSLRQRIAGQPQPAQMAAEVVETLARAMNVAHQRGIIHRDLKPANVLLTPDGIPKIADFGLAKRLDGEPGAFAPGVTPNTAIMGSPSYMAPEQARGKSRDIGPSADVYALGGILYEMLTGRPAFLAQTPTETVLLVLEQEPVPPRRYSPRIPVELEIICLKCLHKDPARRYPRALDLAEDLRRFLDGRPILAVPVSRRERAWKWVKRHPAVAGLLALVILVTLTGLALVTWKWGEALAEWDRAEKALVREAERTRDALLAQQREAEERNRAVEARGREATERERAENRLYLARIQLAQRAWRDNQVGQAESFLDLCPWNLRCLEWNYLRRLCEGSARTLYGHLGPVHAVAFNPEGNQIASGAGDGTVRLWNPETGEELLTLEGHYVVHAVAFSPDGKRLASGGVARGKPKGPVNDGGEVRIWELPSGKLLRAFKPDPARVFAVAFTPDGSQLACGGWDGKIRLCDPNTGEVVRTLEGHQQQVTCLAFASARKVNKEAEWLLASGDGDPASAVRDYPNQQAGRVKLWNARTGKELRTLQGHTRSVMAVAFRSEGQQLASAGYDQVIRLWNPATGEATGTLTGHTHLIHGLAYSSAAAGLLASASGNPFEADRPGELKVWNLAEQREMHTLRGHRDDVHAVAFAPRGDGLASASRDGTVKVWRGSQSPEALALKGHQRGVWGVALSADAKWLATSSADRTIKIWNTRTGAEGWTLKGHTNRVDAVVFAPDGRTLASGGSDGTIRIWDLAAGKEIQTIKVGTHVTAVAFHPDAGKEGQGPPLLASGGWDRAVHLWNLATGKEHLVLRTHSYFVLAVAFSTNGQYLAAGSGNPNAGFGLGSDAEAELPGQVKVWDWKTQTVVQTFRGHHQAVRGVAFHPRGGRIVSVSGDGWRPKQGGEILVWDPLSGEEVLNITGGHTSMIGSVAWSPVGDRIATGSSDRTVRLWDARSGEEALLLTGPRDEVVQVAFAPYAPLLASSSSDGVARLWRADSLEPYATLSGQPGAVLGVAWTPFPVRQRLLASAGADGVVRLWDGMTGQLRQTLRGHEGFVASVAFAPGLTTLDDPVAQRGLASTGADGTIRLWNVATGKETRMWKAHKDRAWRLAFSGDGRQLASVGTDRTVCVWDSATGQETFKRDHEVEVTGVVFLLKGRELAVACADGTVRIWDLGSGKVRLRLEGQTGAIHAIACDKEGRQLATAGEDGLVRLWDAHSGLLLRTMKGHRGAVTSVAFGVGQRMVSTGLDLKVLVWDQETGRCLDTLSGHRDRIRWVAVSSDGDRIATASSDRTVKVWTMP